MNVNEWPSFATETPEAGMGVVPMVIVVWSGTKPLPVSVTVVPPVSGPLVGAMLEATGETREPTSKVYVSGAVVPPSVVAVTATGPVVWAGRNVKKYGGEGNNHTRSSLVVSDTSGLRVHRARLRGL